MQEATSGGPQLQRIVAQVTSEVVSFENSRPRPRELGWWGIPGGSGKGKGKRVGMMMRVKVKVRWRGGCRLIWRLKGQGRGRGDGESRWDCGVEGFMMGR